MTPGTGNFSQAEYEVNAANISLHLRETPGEGQGHPELHGGAGKRSLEIPADTGLSTLHHPGKHRSFLHVMKQKKKGTLSPAPALSPHQAPARHSWRCSIPSLLFPSQLLNGRQAQFNLSVALPDSWWASGVIPHGSSWACTVSWGSWVLYLPILTQLPHLPTEMRPGGSVLETPWQLRPHRQQDSLTF